MEAKRKMRGWGDGEMHAWRGTGLHGHERTEECSIEDRWADRWRLDVSISKGATRRTTVVGCRADAKM